MNTLASGQIFNRIVNLRHIGLNAMRQGRTWGLDFLSLRVGSTDGGGVIKDAANER